MKPRGWLEDMQDAARKVSAGAGFLADTGGALADFGRAARNAATSTGFPFAALAGMRDAMTSGDPSAIVLVIVTHPEVRAWVERWKTARPAKPRRKR